MKKVFILLSFLLIFPVLAFAQNPEKSSSKNSGVIFKIPNDVFPMDWKKSDFKGILMLRKDSPSGIFVTYPNDNESIEDLKKRAAQFIAPMFGGGEKPKGEIDFQTSSIPNHKGDSGDSAAYYLYAGEKNSVQILVYDRAANGASFIYGYFAMKAKDAKDESVKDIWADKNGQGVKIFETFWKTFKD